MKRTFLFFTVMLGIAISTVIAQDSTSSKKVRAIYDLTLDLRRGIQLGAGVLVNTFRPIQVIGSVGKGGSNTSLGLDVTILPFQKAKWFALGVEGIYFFNVKWDVKSILKYGIPVKDAFSSKNGNWIAKQLAFSPNIKLQIPTRVCNIGMKFNPFVFGSWYWYKAGTWKQNSNGDWYQLHGWSGPKQYYSIALYFNFTIAKKEKQKPQQRFQRAKY